MYVRRYVREEYVENKVWNLWIWNLFDSELERHKHKDKDTHCQRDTQMKKWDSVSLEQQCRETQTRSKDYKEIMYILINGLAYYCF
jgi:hypothetical protein